MVTLQGAWIWYELITTDVDAAANFYSTVIGWAIAKDSMPGNGYRFIDAGDGLVGGLLPLTPDRAERGVQPSWLGYLGVDNVDASVAALTAAGARLCMPPTDIPIAGRIAMLKDPDGAPFYVMTPVIPTSGVQSTAFSTHHTGHFSWNELAATDQERAIAFYTGHFGWALPPALNMGPMGLYQFVEHDGTAIGAIMPRPPEMPSALWTHYIRVADIDIAHAAITPAGGTVLMDPHEVPGGDWITHGLDPQGVAFALVGQKWP